MLVKRNMDEMITHFNDVVSAMDISIKDKMTILGMITAIGYEYQEAADAIENLKRDLNFAVRAEAAAAKACTPRWIPVTEEPPLKVGDDGYNGYLIYGIYDGNGYYEVADYTTDKFDNVPYFHVDGEYEPDVTHWMPLPEPPKEKI